MATRTKVYAVSTMVKAMETASEKVCADLSDTQWSAVAEMICRLLIKYSREEMKTIDGKASPAGGESAPAEDAD